MFELPHRLVSARTRRSRFARQLGARGDGAKNHARSNSPQAIILLIGCLLAGAPLHAQTITGTLLSRENDQPIVFGRVVMVTEAGDSVAVTLTNNQGRFSLAAREPGSFRLKASAIGYRESTAGIFDIAAGGEMMLEFRIQPVPLQLEELLVSIPGADRPGLIREATLIRNGFLQRLQMGLGRFFTPDQIQKANALSIKELFYGIPRVRVIDDLRGARLEMDAPMGSCGPPIWVDGVMLSRDGRDLETIAPLQIVSAIEVYRGAAELPLQWGGTAAAGCGAILIWTK